MINSGVSKYKHIERVKTKFLSNRLLSVADATTRIDHAYDGHHRRIAKKVTALVSNTVTSHIRFIYDGWNVIEEHSALGTPPFALLLT